jgi:NAD(P)-dependent dehydrogenase (short-subunit alcohol dehydrogenase family)
LTPNNTATDLSGLVAVVTGAAAGLGRAEAIGLARAGATVVVNDIAGALDKSDVVDEIATAGSKAVAVAGDISERSTADELVETADGLGGLSIVVNNAGITRDRMLFNMTDEDWDAVMSVHLRGHFLLTRNAATYWRAKAKAGAGRPATSGTGAGRPATSGTGAGRSATSGTVYGRIINTSSEAGLAGPVGQANYGAAKAGIAAFSTIVAMEGARVGITSNAIAPTALTHMTLDLMPQEFKDAREAKIADGEFDFFAPENVAPLVAFLCSDASAHISGKVFGVQGDSIEIFQPFTSVAEVKNDGRRWDPEDIPGRIDELFTASGVQAGAENMMARMRYQILGER